MGGVTRFKPSLIVIVSHPARCSAIRYHMGTIAFGALLMTIVKVIRYIVRQTEKNTKAKSSTCWRAPGIRDSSHGKGRAQRWYLSKHYQTVYS